LGITELVFLLTIKQLYLLGSYTEKTFINYSHNPHTVFTNKKVAIACCIVTKLLGASCSKKGFQPLTNF